MPPVSPIWYVLHVRPRTERKVMERLALCGAWRYLPVQVRVRRTQRRRIRVELPLFPGYVFARLDADRRRAMLRSNLLVRLIPIPDPRGTIHQLRQIRRAGRLAPLKPLPAFAPGEEVRVASGPFYGLTGYVDTAGRRLVLSVDILGRAVAVSIDPDDCVRI